MSLWFNSSIIIKKILLNNYVITYVNISRNKIGDNGIKVIMQAVKFSKSIVHFNI